MCSTQEGEQAPSASAERSRESGVVRLGESNYLATKSLTSCTNSRYMPAPRCCAQRKELNCWLASVSSWQVSRGGAVGGLGWAGERAR